LRDFILQHLILRTRSCGTGCITQPSWLLHFHPTKMVGRKCFVCVSLQLRRGVSGGPALKYLCLILRVGRVRSCCNVLQCVAVCCSVLQCIAVSLSRLRRWCTALCPILSEIHHCTLPHTATHCNTLQHTATHCNTTQHNATQRSKVR